MMHDEIYNQWKDISDLPQTLIERLRLTYKTLPYAEKSEVITHLYGKEEAHHVINISFEEYRQFVQQANRSLKKLISRMLFYVGSKLFYLLLIFSFANQQRIA